MIFFVYRGLYQAQNLTMKIWNTVAKSFENRYNKSRKTGDFLGRKRYDKQNTGNQKQDIR